MDKSGRSVSPIFTAVAVGSVGIAFLAVSLLGPPRSKAQGSYMQPPVIHVPPPIVRPPFNNPISNPLDVTKVIPGQEGVINNEISALGTSIGGPATLGITTPSKFPNQEDLKGPTDYILVQPEAGATLVRETPYLVSLTEGTLLASVKRPSSMGMIHTPLGEVAFSANSDAFITFTNGALRIRNVDGMGQTLKIKITSGPLAGKIYAVAPGYEFVVSDHKLGKSDLRPNDGIMRRASQTFDNGFAGVSQYHVHSALAQSGVVSHLTAKEASDTMARKVIGDMSRMAAVLNHVQGGTGYGP
jgi:hypothetical protein